MNTSSRSQAAAAVSIRCRWPSVIAVGHHRAHGSPRRRPLRQLEQASAQAVPEVLHQQAVARAENGIEAEFTKHGFVARLGEEHQMANAPGKGLLPQRGHQRRGQPLALTAGAHGDALQRRAVQRTGGLNLAVLHQQRRELNARIVAQSVFSEERFQTLQRFAAQRPARLQVHANRSFACIVHSIPKIDKTVKRGKRVK